MEIWKPISGWPYSVSDQGRVRNDRTGRILKACPNSMGYLSVGLRSDGRRKTYMAHGLVLRVFVGPPKPDQEARHLNGHRTDNKLVNLVWGTAEQNYDDRRRHGTDNQGERHGRVKLTISQVRLLKKLLKTQTASKLARQFNVSPSTLRDIRIGKNWGWLTEE